MDYKETARQILLENRNGESDESRQAKLREVEKYQVQNIAEEDTERLHRKLALSSHQSRLLSEIQVNIGVELGQINLNIEDIIDLVPGSIFEFSFDKQKTLTLKLGNLVIGKARLVKVEDELALEIISIGENMCKQTVRRFDNMEQENKARGKKNINESHEGNEGNLK